jgi:hypothetical protein
MHFARQIPLKFMVVFIYVNPVSMEVTSNSTSSHLHHGLCLPWGSFLTGKHSVGSSYTCTQDVLDSSSWADATSQSRIRQPTWLLRCRCIHVPTHCSCWTYRITAILTAIPVFLSACTYFCTSVSWSPRARGFPHFRDGIVVTSLLLHHPPSPCQGTWT